jgi:PAS domain S-box-containing protein
MLCFLLILASSAGAQLRQTRRVLVINELGTMSSPGFAEVDEAILNALQNSPYQIELYQESLQLTFFPEEASQRAFRESLIHKYLERKPDVIIAAGSASLQLIAESHHSFIQNTPVVFCAVLGKIPEELKSDLYITGVLGRLQPEETLKAALHLLPGTKHVVVVGGVGKFDEGWESAAKQAFQNYESKLEFTYLTNLTMPILLARLSHLPSNTIVYHTAISQDAAGSRFIDSAQSVPLVASAANAPVFVMDDVDLRAGTVGGALVNWADDGRVAGDMAVRVLNGERPEDIPIAMSNNAYMFDWRALTRWGLKESDLPPASIVLYRPRTAWEAYKWYIISGIAVMFAETLLILALLWQRKRRKESEIRLRESEERLCLAAQIGRMFAYSWDAATDVIERSGESTEILGVQKQEAATGAIVSAMVHPDDKERIEVAMATLSLDNPMLHITYRILRRDGAVAWLERNSRAYFDGNGKLKRVVGMVVDVTERERAKEALAEMTRKLIAAQEQERARIGRELHDDINQRLAMVAVGLERLQQHPSGGQSSVQELRQEVAGISNDVQALSHDLHASKLEYLGVIAGMKSWCKEFAERQRMRIDFKSEMSLMIPLEIGHTLFRVLQEALHNVIKHSGVKRVDLQLWGNSAEIHLLVTDLGRGFDVEGAFQGRGLGLWSMRERVRLVDGTISIESKPMSGVKIHVCVPLAAEHGSAVSVNS